MKRLGKSYLLLSLLMLQMVPLISTNCYALGISSFIPSARGTYRFVAKGIAIPLRLTVKALGFGIGQAGTLAKEIGREARPIIFSREGAMIGATAFGALSVYMFCKSVQCYWRWLDKQLSLEQPKKK